jgi:hypothetical protein
MLWHKYITKQSQSVVMSRLSHNKYITTSLRAFLWSVTLQGYSHVKPSEVTLHQGRQEHHAPQFDVLVALHKHFSLLFLLMYPFPVHI